jgi:hypothetical protein
MSAPGTGTGAAAPAGNDDGGDGAATIMERGDGGSDGEGGGKACRWLALLAWCAGISSPLAAVVVRIVR